MPKSFESNMANALNIHELKPVAKRIEKYQAQLEETLNFEQKKLLNNLLCNKSKAMGLIAIHCVNSKPALKNM